MIYIFDLDGTISDNSHRLHYIKGKKKNWKKYADECDSDKPIEATILVARALKRAHHTVIILTGRTARVREKTELWLNVYNVPYDRLYMRPEGDFRPDTDYKLDIVKNKINGQITAVFDDRPKMVKFWRDNDITCFDIGGN